MENNVSNFINKVIKELTYEHDKHDDEIDIPFILATLQQSLEKNPDSEFLSDLCGSEFYDIRYIVNDEKDYLSLGKILVSLSNCTYEFEIFIDLRPGDGYCWCKLGDEDYREDKDCCGHDCDWQAPALRLSKTCLLMDYRWQGDEHSYWDYEDDFYRVNEELLKEKEERERLKEIESLHASISASQSRLDELLNRLK